MPPAPGPPGLCDPGLGSVRADFGGGLPVGAPSAQSWSAGPLLLLVEEAAVSTPWEQQSPLPSSKDPPDPPRQMAMSLWILAEDGGLPK